MYVRCGGTVLQLRLPKSRTARLKLLTLVTITLFFLSTVFFFAGLRNEKEELVVTMNDEEADKYIAEEWAKRQQRRLAYKTAAPDHEFAGDHRDNDDHKMVLAPVMKNMVPPEPVDMNGVRPSFDDPAYSKVKMAMGEKHKEKYVIQMQKKILREQKRPPDSHYNVNITLSDMISMDRDVTDTRPPVCKTFKYNLAELPTVSVVIPFYNEALSMLLRTVHSILLRSPDILLQEIILVDDASTREYLFDPFERYIQMLPKVKILRNVKRNGLIRSRLRGFDESTGDVVVFLDAHTEANVGWLEPMLYELKKHPDSILQPFVDGIDAMNIEYTAPGEIYTGSFSWDLRYTWIKVPNHVIDLVKEHGTPYPSPTLVGCAIAVERKFFNLIGRFDEGLEVWGGENLELAFRAWQCNSRVHTIPCSRVGHVFKNFPYKFNGDKDKIVTKNLMRVADTWMDGMRKYFYATTRIYDFKLIDFTPEEKKAVLERKHQLRTQFKCRNFEWYMYNIIPWVEPPPMDAVYYGEIMNSKTRSCFEVLEDYYVGMTYLCYEHKIIPKNYFYIDKNLDLLHYRDKCVTFDAPDPILTLAECPTNAEDAKKFGMFFLEPLGVTWGFLKAKKIMSDGVMHWWCVAQVTNILPQHNGVQMPQITSCEPNDDYFIWIFSHKMDYSDLPDDIILDQVAYDEKREKERNIENRHDINNNQENVKNNNREF